MEEEMKGEERSADEAGKDGNDVVLDMDNLLWVKYMEAKLDTKSKHCQPSHPFTISRVPPDIRMVDTHAYEPLFVSIGPYHRGNQSLVDMEEVKWRNLKEFRGRAGESFNKYLKTMKEIETRARACYSGNIDMKEDEFIEMMLLDGLFITELLKTRGKSFLALLGFFNIDIKEPICTGMLSRVGQDMFLLENQLPFFVLERLWNLTGQGSGFDLRERACVFILDFALPFEHEWDLNLLRVIFDEEEKKRKENSEMKNEDGVHHLLHLVYLLLKPTSLTRKSESMDATGNSELSMEPTGSSELSMKPTAKLPAFIKQKKSTFRPPRCRICFPFPSCQESQAMQPISSRLLPEFKMKMKTISFQPPRCRICFPCQSSPSPSDQESQSMKCTAKLSAVIKKILKKLSPSKSKVKQPPPLAVIPSAAELDEAGVEFVCVQAQSFLDIEFERGTMKMPRLSVQDSTMSLLRNFIAFEQSFPNRGSHMSHITSYCCFMDDLVNTPRDVEILKKSAIIENCLGCDKEVADLFNDLCKGIFSPDESSNYLAKPSEDVRKHTKKVWPKWRAKLCHDYFGSPWSIISFLGATFVIILTIVQTYYAVFT